MILVALGLTALAGCSLIQSKPVATNCPPVVPVLPPINHHGQVILRADHQRDLLLYFMAVERCF